MLESFERVLEQIRSAGVQGVCVGGGGGRYSIVC